MVEYFFSNIGEAKMDPVSIKGANNAFIQWLITRERGANYAVRKFTLEKDGIIPMHVHKYQETVIIIKGRCRCCAGDKVYQMKEGDYIFINSDVKHAFINLGYKLEFFCIIDYHEDMNIRTIDESCS